MRILLAPDSFKESLSAAGAAQAMARGVERAAAALGVRMTSDLCPIADGGEGTVEAIATARGWPLKTARVTGPLGEPVNAAWCVEAHEPHGRAYEGAKWLLVAAVAWFFTSLVVLYLLLFPRRRRTAIIDAASACGLGLVPLERRDPGRTTTFGVGELLKAALNEGATTVVVGVGGTGTCDGGIGMLDALGVRFYDGEGVEIRRPVGNDLERIHRIDPINIDPHLHKSNLIVATDVRNPLLGPRGAAAVYGPQKGATPEQVKRLDRGLARLVELARAADLDPNPDAAGSGAGGGLGFSLRTFCGAEIVGGAHAVLESVRFRQRAARAALVLTGEGRLDAQSLEGKACVAVARAAADVGVETIALAGSVEAPFETRGGAGAAEGIFAAARAIAPPGTAPEESIARAPEFLEAATERVVIAWVRERGVQE